jgi:excisionase family DNA binding protein
MSLGARVLNMNHEVMDQNFETTPLMTPQEVADFLGMPLATLQSWRAQRTGPPGYRVGRHVRYRREDVEAWLEERSDAARRGG